MSEMARSLCSVVGERPALTMMRVRVDLLDLGVGDLQHLGVRLGVGLLVAPLAREVRLVPDLVDLDLALVALGERLDEVLPVFQLVRRPGGREDLVAARPVGLVVEAGDDPQAGLVDRVDDEVGLVPLEARSCGSSRCCATRSAASPR